MWLRPAFLISSALISFSALAVGNGIRTENYSPVVKIGISAGDCTGTMIAPNLILTAKHCFTGRGEDVREGVLKLKAAFLINEKILKETVYFHIPIQPTHHIDIAIVEIQGEDLKLAPKETYVPDYHPYLFGTPIEIVGYGYSDTVHRYDATRQLELLVRGQGKGGGKRRFGSNRIAGYPRGTLVRIQGSAKMPRNFWGEAPTGLNVLNLQGDSGGPMLVGDRIIGVACTVNPNLEGTLYVEGDYSSLSDPEAAAFIQHVLEERALTPERPHVPPLSVGGNHP